nr:hypothetical protein [Tanacetum cinerariifolium]
MRNNSNRVNHKNFANKLTHPHPKRGFIPQAVLTRLGKINIAGASVTTDVRPVNTVGSKSIVNHPRLISNAFKRGHSQVIRPFNKYSAYKKTMFNNEVNAVKASGCWVWRPKQNVTDHVSKQNSASLTFKRFDYIDVQGRVLDLEKRKTAQAKEIADLKKRVTKIGKKEKGRIVRIKRRLTVVKVTAAGYGFYCWMSKVLFSMERLKKRCMYVNHQDLKIHNFLIEYTRLKKHCMDYIKLLEPEVKNASTSMETQKPLLKDEDYKEVDVHMYRSMIGSLMYLTSSRHDIMFLVYACARYQVNPKNDDEEEEYEKEYVRTPDSMEFTDDDEEYEELYKDVKIRLQATEHEKERKIDKEMTDAGHDKDTQ